MDNFRRRTRDDQRQAIDSILNAPVRTRGFQRPLAIRRQAPIGGLHSVNGSRRLDDFRRAEGLHAPQQNGVRASAASQSQRLIGDVPNRRAEQRSILHTTLPTGTGVILSKKQQEQPKKDKAKQKPQSRMRIIRKWSLRSGIALAAVTLLIGGFLITKGILKVNKVFKGGGSSAALQANVTPTLLKGEGDGRVNILMMGKGGPGHDGPDLTDTMLVASIDPVNKTAALVSVPRDLWVSPPGLGSSKVNAVYAETKYRALARSPKDTAQAQTAGVNAAEKMVSDVLGVPINYYVMVDFTAFKEAVDTVGGVTINVPTELVDPTMAWENNWNPVLARQGVQTFNGKQALLYVRSRHGSARGDFDRTERQRLFITALAEKVLSVGTYTNPVKISQLMSAFGDHVSTDFSVNDALRLAEIAKGMNLSKMQSIGLADPPNNYVTTGTVGNQSIVKPVAGIGDYSQIQNYIRSVLKDPYLARENAPVVVLNGTTVSGLATTTSNTLKSYGYNVTTVADAPTQDYGKTVLVDLSGGKDPFTKNYLEKRFDVTAATKLPDPNIKAPGADFVLILGQDASTNQ